MDGNFSEISQFRGEFHRLLDAGTGRSNGSDARPSAWDAVSFYNALVAGERNNNPKRAIPTQKTIRNWLSKDRTRIDFPQERFIEPILDLLFPNDPVGRAAFHGLWQDTKDARRTVEALDNDPPPSSTVQWAVTDAENIGLGLARLLVHPPAPSNAMESFLLQLSLSLAQKPDEIEGFGVRLGLKAAHLQLDHINCVPLPIEDGLDFVQDRGGVYPIVGPLLEPWKHLEGRPLANTTLLSMQRSGDGPAKVTVTLRSRKRDLEVLLDDPEHDLSDNKLKVLQAFLQECHVPDADRQIVWGKATLTEKTPSCD